MQQQAISSLPLYPEERRCSRPTAEQLFRLFSLLERHELRDAGVSPRVFPPTPTELQCTVLGLLHVLEGAYRAVN